ncbi:hypothetical protein GCM10023091_07810 [Ravibacter arvi]|uniref:Uncharacterized protein n=2 Tax=Ravibacter arvi TaxID=2051041 RepID=A0ABP8LSP9_9BACT
MPGDYLTMVFKTGRTADSVTARLTVPEEWHLLSQMQVPSGDGRNFYYSVASKSNSRAGLYPVKFEVFTRGKLQDSRTVNVPVRAISRIDILTVSPPEYAKEGETLFSEFVVHNLGNRVENPHFSGTGGEVETDSASLQPGESTVVRMKREVPHTDQTNWLLSQGLSVTVAGNAEPYRKYISIPVYATKPKKTDSYLRFPVEAGATFLHYRMGDISHTGFQYFVNGKGSLDVKKQHMLDFSLRGPNQRSFPVLGNYDHYSATYTYKNRFIVTAGDFHLSFNNLMELGRYGRGVYLQGRVKNFGGRVFYQKARLFPMQKDSYGGEVSLFLKKGEIAASYFSKNAFVKNQWQTTRMAGLSSRIQSKTVSWEAEWSVGNTLNRYDMGVFSRLYYRYRKLTVSNNLIYTGENYFGFYTNSRLLVTNVGYYFNPKVGLGVTHNYSLINPGLDVSVYNTSPFTNTYVAYVTFSPGSRNRFFLNYTIGDRKDRQKPPTYDYHENLGNFFYNFEGQQFRLMNQVRYGYTRNNLAGNDLRRRRTYASGILQPSFRLWREAWLSGFAEYQYTSRFSNQDRFEHLFFWGGNLSIVQKRIFQLSLMYRNSYAPDELYQSRSYLSISSVLNLKHHQLALQGGNIYHPNPDLRYQNTLFFSLTYTLKLNAPLARIKNTGRVVGKVTGLYPDIGKDGMLIRLGGKEYLTGPAGEFSFNNVAEDKYLLTLQRMQVVDGVVPTVKIPMEIVVRKDSVTYLEIPFSKTGGLQGKVKFMEENPAQPGKPLVLIKLYREGATYLTDLKDGNVFSFKEILPGNWNLKIIPQDAGYEAETEDQVITIEPDKIREVNLVIKARERKIFFSNQNFQISVKE